MFVYVFLRIMGVGVILWMVYLSIYLHVYLSSVPDNIEQKDCNNISMIEES